MNENKQLGKNHFNFRLHDQITQLNKQVKTMITYRETKRISLSDSSLHSLTGNAHFCGRIQSMKPFLVQISLWRGRVKLGSVPCVPPTDHDDRKIAKSANNYSQATEETGRRMQCRNVSIPPLHTQPPAEGNKIGKLQRFIVK